MMVLRAMAITVAVFALSGCKSDLVTGYEPRRLGDSPTERRGYYASPFSPEARAADEEREETFRARRPPID